MQALFPLPHHGGRQQHKIPTKRNSLHLTSCSERADHGRRFWPEQTLRDWTGFTQRLFEWPALRNLYKRKKNLDAASSHETQSCLPICSLLFIQIMPWRLTLHQTLCQRCLAGWFACEHAWILMRDGLVIWFWYNEHRSLNVEIINDQPHDISLYYKLRGC